MSERGASRFDRSIVDGPLVAAVWRLAWPTMLQNIVGGLQGIIDHVMVGHYVGYVANAAIGVSWQVFLVVMVFITSLYTGMGVLVARFAGAGDAHRVDAVVYQAFLTSVFLSVGVLAPLGYVAAPGLLGLVQAAPAVRAEALPYLRILFVFGGGMLLYFMLAGALRAAGDAQTPFRLGVAMTVLNMALNVVLIRGAGPIPAFGTAGAAMGTVIASGIAAAIGLWLVGSGRLVVHFKPGMSWRPDWGIIRALFRFGLPAGVQGIVMNVAGVLLLYFIGTLDRSAEAQAVYAVGYTELFSLVTWTSVGLMGAAATVAGQNLGAGRPDRSARAVGIAAAIGVAMAAFVGTMFLLVPRTLLALFGMRDPVVVDLGVTLLRFLSVSGFFITVALAYTGGLQGTGDTRSPLYVSLVAQIAVPVGLCSLLRAAGGLDPADIWLAILLGHFTRCVLSVWIFRQGRWKAIPLEVGSVRASST
jgi:putative MATE family efflux protein